MLLGSRPCEPVGFFPIRVDGVFASFSQFYLVHMLFAIHNQNVRFRLRTYVPFWCLFGYIHWVGLVGHLGLHFVHSKLSTRHLHLLTAVHCSQSNAHFRGSFVSTSQGRKVNVKSLTFPVYAEACANMAPAATSRWNDLQIWRHERRQGNRLGWLCVNL